MTQSHHTDFMDSCARLARSVLHGNLCPETHIVRTRVNCDVSRHYAQVRDDEATIARMVIAMLRGAESGLAPLTALYNIVWFNDRPCIWGDAALALVCAHDSYVSHYESINADKDIATCTITRGENQFTGTFTRADAQRAGLADKDVWKKYPERMLIMRARSWAMRDSFPDVFAGLSIAEEQRDVEISASRPAQETPQGDVMDPYTQSALDVRGEPYRPSFDIMGHNIADIAADIKNNPGKLYEPEKPQENIKKTKSEAGQVDVVIGETGLFEVRGIGQK